ncbi:putative bifunctional diguanylate cyclase/phosphodiesterase [Actinoplanes couchii]|uniref:Diguanylate cyclase/phosphodiesterase n=1 Tax=Actinoplanes couchii TaxID=403638 RepID=A0ABQ3XTL6_9ACTN|nr:bifunctional diguanylate cyclase/phosphodiesterase [Actinoplanes couchii]MDR6324119.1 diguanylate cyclase (GGDEF)-like protein [Actinoplanes couchii]GID61854.1 hypothetical protein Aco03nite_102580 [Actinoplanes couchii]
MMLVVITVATQFLGVLDAGLRPLILAVTLPTLDLLGAFYSARAARHSAFAVYWRIAAAGRLCAVLSVAVGIIGNLGGGEGWAWANIAAQSTALGLLASAVLFSPFRLLHSREAVTFLAQVVAVFAGGFMLLWNSVLIPVLASGHPLQIWVAALWLPLGNLLLFSAVAASLLSGTVTQIRNPITVLVAGLGLYSVAGSGWPVLTAHGLHTGQSAIACLILTTAALLMTVAPMLIEPRPRAPLTMPIRVTPAWAPYLPVAALAGGGTLLMVVSIREDDLIPWGGLVVAMTVMAGALSVHQHSLLREHRDMIVTDPLTGLMNRSGFDAALTQALSRDEQPALLLVDLDGFALINEAHGHAAGDAVLIETAHQLRASMRSVDVTARLAGNEFAVLVNGRLSEQAIIAVTTRILEAFATHPVHIGGDTVPIRASIGVTTAACSDPLTLFTRAGIALYQAKRARTHSYMMWDVSMIDRRADDAALAAELDHALERGELQVLYQPLIDLGTGRPVAAEALLRWHHPTRGTISPVTFIPIAEHTGAIVAIGVWVLEEALRQLAAWPDNLYISVNLSPRQLQEPTLVHEILAVLTHAGVDANRLVLEVTESALVDATSAVDALTALRSHGARIAIDDFGTGYSSMRYLTRLPVDILKIDRSFVAELNDTTHGSAITEAIVRLAQVLHLTTVAEGIETEQQASELRALGCPIGQGFLYSPPRSAAALSTMMAPASLVPTDQRTDRISPR